VGIAGGLGFDPPVNVYSLTLLSENPF